MSLFTKLVDRAFAAGGAILFMQAPQFIQNYVQILSGHLAELTYQLNHLQLMTEKSGRTVIDLAAKFMKNSDPDIVFQGELLQGLVERQASFNQALQSLTHASAINKPFIFASHVDSTLFKETWATFKLDLPVSLEGVVWGLAGLFFGYFLFRLLAATFRLTGLTAQPKATQ